MASGHDYHEGNDTELNSPHNPAGRTDYKGIYTDFETLQKIAIAKFGSIGGFASALGICRSHGSDILSGKYIIRKPATLRRVAEVLQIDVIVLTQLYERQAQKKETK